MSGLYPLRFEPHYKDYLWGGRRLETLLGKKLGDGPTYAESWEVVDHGADQSVVADGHFAGRKLGELAQEFGHELYGKHYPQKQFPLLFKFLDAKRTLSVQVHPNDAQGAKLNPPDLGKTEAWVVLAAEKGSKLYAGLRPGVDRPALAEAVEAGTCEECLHAFEPKVGDCVFIEAGTVHALGEGLVIAEIQQASNTTFRLFDWNRVDADGKPRPLHIDQSLSTIDFTRGPVQPQTPLPLDGEYEELVRCDKFVLGRYELTGSVDIDLKKNFHLLACIGGHATIHAGDHLRGIEKGATLLVPAVCGSIRIEPQPECNLLAMHLPD